MYEEHSVVTTDLRDDARLWRYMSLSSFIWILNEKSLSFNRIDQFDDSMEGSFGSKNLVSDEDTNVRYLNYKGARQAVYANCWHANSYESAAMWNLYCRSNEGIAIKTTIGKLKKSFNFDPRTILIGDIKYIDHRAEYVPSENLFEPVIRKQKSFEHEKEIRAFLMMHGTRLVNGQACWVPDLPVELQPLRLSVRVDVDELITDVYLAPKSSAWYSKMVKGVCDKFGLVNITYHDGLNNKPLF